MRTRTFILVAVALFAVLVGGFVYVAIGDGDERRLGAIRSYVAGKWSLDVNGAHVGYLKKVEGCGVAADTIGTAANKQPGQPTYGPCQLQLPVNQATVQWITDVLQGKAGARNLSLLQIDSANKVVLQLDLGNALLKEFSLPALDAANKDQLNFNVTIAPESIQKGKGAASPPASPLQKSMLAANFRLTIAGIDTTRVNRIGSWSFEVPIEQGAKSSAAIAGPPKLSNLVVETSEVAAPSFESYLDTFLIKGETAAEKTGTIEFLSADLKTVLFQIDFGGMGIIAGEFFGASESSADTIARREFSFYVETAALTLGK